METAKKSPWWQRKGLARRTYDFKKTTLMRLDRKATSMRMTRVALLELIINTYCMTEKEKQEAKNEYVDIF